MEHFKNKNIAVLGFGIEGMSVCDYLIATSSNITVLDEKKRADFDEKMLLTYESRGISFILGKIEDLTGFDIIFRSPGFHPDLQFLKTAKEKGIEISSAIKLFFDLCPCPIIGVTGTKGKGTTSTLIYEILKLGGFDVYLGGNIGTPPLGFLEKLKPDSKVVLELSSFQLIDLGKSPADAKAMVGKPHIAVVLMTTSEHLDYHPDVYEYIDAKRNIFRYQTENDFAIVNRDYPASNESDIHSNGKIYKVSREQEVEEGCFVKEGLVYIKMDGHAASGTFGEPKKEEIIATKDILLPGRHNYENVCAAVVAAILAGATIQSIIPVLKSFKGLEHRIELVKTVKGVRYYDDSFSTTPETAIASIEAFDEPKILILGGSSKNSDFSELGEIISESDSIKAIIGIGVEWEKIKESIKYQVLSIKYIEGLENMKQVVDKASEIAEIGDVVLLSPACASFDMFKSYKDRGGQFKEEVNKL